MEAAAGCPGSFQKAAMLGGCRPSRRTAQARACPSPCGRGPRAGDERWQRPRPGQAEFPRSVSRVLQIKIAASMTETLKIALLTQSALRILWERARWPEGWPHGPHANSGRRRGRDSGQWVPAAGRRPQGPSHTAPGRRGGDATQAPAVASALGVQNGHSVSGP